MNVYTIAGKHVKYVPGAKDDNKEMRVSFAFDANDNLVVQETGDDRPMVMVLGMQGNSMFEEIVRGVFDSHNIILFIGEYYMQVPDVQNYEELLYDLRPHINKRFGYDNHDIAIWTGVKIGEPGTIWTPISLVGKLRANNSIVWFDN